MPTTARLRPSLRAAILPVRTRLACAGDDNGSVSVFAVIAVVALFIIAGLVFDGGARMKEGAHADAVAQEAARAGGQQIDPDQAIPGNAIVVDRATAVRAARSYLSAAGVSGSVQITENGRALKVNVMTSYQPKFLGAIGVGTLQVRGHGRAQLVHGVNRREGP
jgi:hypothetical protein